MKRNALLLCLFFFVFYYAVFFPGIVREDSSDQLGQALRHQITDWHSPVMTLIWSWVNQIYVGPAGMLLLTDLGFFTALAIILSQTLSGGRTRCNVLLILTLFPINFCLIGNVTKTSFFSAVMLLAIAVTALAVPGRRLLGSIISALLLFLAISIRPDGIAAALPVFVWMFWEGIRNLSFVTWRNKGTLLAALVVGSLASLLCYALVQKINRTICGEERTYPEQVFLVSDLFALSVAQGEVLVPAPFLNSDTDLALLQKLYPCGTSVLFWSTAPPFHTTRDAGEMELLRAKWAHEVTAHPWDYLRERTVACSYFLGFHPHTYAAPLFSVWPNTWGYFPSFEAVHADFKPGPLSDLEVLLYYYTRSWFIQMPWFFIVLSLLVIPYLLRYGSGQPERDRIGLLLAFSGLAHIGFLCLMTPDPDYRYSSWLIFSSSLAVLLTWMGRREERGGKN